MRGVRGFLVAFTRDKKKAASAGRSENGVRCRAVRRQRAMWAADRSHQLVGHLQHAAPALRSPRRDRGRLVDPYAGSLSLPFSWWVDQGPDHRRVAAPRCGFMMSILNT